MHESLDVGAAGAEEEQDEATRRRPRCPAPPHGCVCGVGFECEKRRGGMLLRCAAAAGLTQRRRVVPCLVLVRSAFSFDHHTHTMHSIRQVSSSSLGCTPASGQRGIQFNWCLPRHKSEATLLPALPIISISRNAGYSIRTPPLHAPHTQPTQASRRSKWHDDKHNDLSPSWR